jgi:hypothetical protein
MRGLPNLDEIEKWNFVANQTVRMPHSGKHARRERIKLSGPVRVLSREEIARLYPGKEKR